MALQPLMLTDPPGSMSTPGNALGFHYTMMEEPPQTFPTVSIIGTGQDRMRGGGVINAEKICCRRV